MDKVIVLEMCDNKDISIKLNDIEKIKINKDNRKISAEDIFNLLDYSIGDQYRIKIRNESNIDPKVIEFFKDLLSGILDKLVKDL